jgi:hypothetical protein
MSMRLWLLLGAAGGGTVEVLAILEYVLAWQRARRTTNRRQVRKSRPQLRKYIDLPADALVLAIRMLLGAMTTWLFAASGQISGPYAAFCLGLAAPAMLAQLGRLSKVDQVIQGDTSNRFSSISAPPPAEPLAKLEEEVDRQ